MKKIRVEFAYQDTNARGLRFKNAKRTVKALSNEDAIRKIEASLGTAVIDPKFTELPVQPSPDLSDSEGSPCEAALHDPTSGEERQLDPAQTVEAKEPEQDTGPDITMGGM